MADLPYSARAPDPSPSRPPASVSAPKAPRERDLRIDFIRGLVMVVLVVVHIELVSAFTFLAWERVGLIAGGEGFVILAGVVLGMVSRERIAKRGWAYATKRLVDRGAQLYRVNVAVIVIVGLLSFVPSVDWSAVTTFTDRFAQQTYPLYPPRGTPLVQVLGQVLLLKVGPHEIQILGLYVVLMLASPLMLWMMFHGRTQMLLAISWLLYFANALAPRSITGAQFENAFPLLTWQLIYVHGLAAGWHRERLEAFLRSRRGLPVMILAFAITAACFFLAQNTPNPVVPEALKLHLVPADTFNRWHLAWFEKNTLGLGRILNYFAFLPVLYALLTWTWPVANRLFGWFLVPLGQASLYVFVMHVFVVALVANVRPFGFDVTPAGLAINTVVHAAALLLLWFMAKTNFLGRWVPR